MNKFGRRSPRESNSHGFLFMAATPDENGCCESVTRSAAVLGFGAPVPWPSSQPRGLFWPASIPQVVL